MSRLPLLSAGGLLVAIGLLAVGVPWAPLVAQEQSPPVPAEGSTVEPPQPADPARAPGEMTVERKGKQAPITAIEEETAPDGRPMRAGSLIVKFQSGAAAEARDAAHQAANALAIEPLSLPDTVRAQVPPGTTAQALASYRAQPEVEYAVPDYIVRGTSAPR